MNIYTASLHLQCVFSFPFSMGFPYRTLNPEPYVEEKSEAVIAENLSCKS